jgi:DNA-binding MarR family transcriptional regulator
VLTRSRNTKQAVLKITGRDVEEAEHALELDAAMGVWTMLDGPATDYTLSDERRSILAALRDTEGLGPKQIAEASGVTHDVVKHLVRKMAEDGQIDTDGNGHYFPIHSIHCVHSEPEAVNAVNRVNGEHDRARQRALEEFE